MATQAHSDGGFLEAYSLLVELCKLGARPPVIRSMVPAIITNAKIYATYRAVTGSAPPQGQLPQSITAHLKSPSQRINTTCVATLLMRTDPALPLARRCIQTYHLYQQVAGDEAVFDFQRIWFLCRATLNRQIKITSCRTCRSKFVYDAEIVSDEKCCPYCSLANTSNSAAVSSGSSAQIQEEVPKGVLQLDLWGEHSVHALLPI